MFSSKLSQNSYLYMYQSQKKIEIKGNPISVKYNKCVSTGNQTSRETSTDTQYIVPLEWEPKSSSWECNLPEIMLFP